MYGMTIIGDALKAHRTKHGLTQTQLATQLGCKQGLLAHWEGGGRPTKYAVAVARVLGWTMTQLDEAMREVDPVGKTEPPDELGGVAVDAKAAS